MAGAGGTHNVTRQISSFFVASLRFMSSLLLKFMNTLRRGILFNNKAEHFL
jgi:hypothetical protein